jgi:RimJ/RimL family protein N-acetyltransferase
MTRFEIPTLATDRLRLRAFRASDLDAYAAMQADPEVMRYLVIGRTSTRAEVWRTMATSLGAWALRGYGMWACEKIDDGTFIGSVGIFEPLDWPEPEISYSLDRPYWRQGFATEAAKAARDWLFEHFGSSRAASFIRPDNYASKRVAERLGAVYERPFELRGSTYEYWVHYRADGNSRTSQGAHLA